MSNVTATSGQGFEIDRNVLANAYAMTFPVMEGQFFESFVKILVTVLKYCMTFVKVWLNCF